MLLYTLAVSTSVGGSESEQNPGLFSTVVFYISIPIIITIFITTTVFGNNESHQHLKPIKNRTSCPHFIFFLLPCLYFYLSIGGKTSNTSSYTVVLFYLTFIRFYERSLAMWAVLGLADRNYIFK